MNSLEERLESRIEEIERQQAAIAEQMAAIAANVAEDDTRLNATEQALAAFQVSRQNAEKISNLEKAFSAMSRLLRLLEKAFNSISCVLVGAALIWFGNPLINDPNPTNDHIGSWLFMGGGGCIVYGLLVLTGNEQWVIRVFDAVNPWKQR